MITLATGPNAIQWTGPDTAIADLPGLPNIDRIFAVNPVTSTGYVGYQRNGLYPTLTALHTGTSYLVYATATLTLDTALVSTTFPGYPGTPTTPPVVVAPANLVVSATAATDIIVGRLLGRVNDGVIHYDATDPDHRQRFLGISLNSAMAGTVVNIQQRGTVLIPGLGLGASGGVLHARAAGQLGLSSDGMAFQHIVGRVLTPDSFFLTAQSTYSL